MATTPGRRQVMTFGEKIEITFSQKEPTEANYAK